MEEIYKLWKEEYTYICGEHKYVRKMPAIYISNMGNVKGRKISKNSDGYLRFMYDNKWYFIHRLVAELFCYHPKNCNIVDHIDTDINNNCYTNLRWTTQKGNCNNPLTLKRYSISHKGILKGGKHPRSKKVHDNVSGKDFECAKDYAEFIKRNYATVKCWLKGKNPFPSQYSAYYF